MTQMRKLNILLFILLVGILLAPSCDDMNDIQSKFADLDEQVYLGKVDSLKIYPGLGRVKITWYVSADPKIDKTIIYWNMRGDSIVKEFNRNTPGVQKDSIIIEDLPEGSTLFEFRNISSDGEYSLYSMATATVWGTQFGNGLYSRKVTSRNFDFEKSSFELGFSPTFEGDSVVFSQVEYTTNEGEKKTLRIDRETELVTLSNFTDGGELNFRTAFFLPTGIDTVFNDYQTFKSPTAVFDNGERLSLEGNLDSKYFERDGSLYEWNLAGDIIVYELNEDDLFIQTKAYLSSVSRDVYRDFFFYDDDKFIGITVGDQVSMLQFIDDEFVIVKTPDGKDFFGTWYDMEKFIAARGFFFSIKGGDIRTWLANNNATWGTPNGTTVGTGFTYNPVILFNNRTLLGVDVNGYLYSIPITTTGVLGNKSTIGSGWDKFKNFVSVGEKLLCLDDEGVFYQYDFNTTDYYWVIE